MRKMMKYGKLYGGADPRLIEGDMFRMIVSAPEFGGQTTTEGKLDSKHDASSVTGEVTGEVRRLLTVLSGEMKRTEIQEKLEIKHEDYFREAYLLPALKAALIEMTVPDKPRSSKQRYRITESGRKALEDASRKIE